MSTSSQVILLILTTLFAGNTTANNDTSTATADSGVTDISKAFISLGVLGGACLAAFIIAKVVDHCYDRAALRDDASDISEHTRQLIRARIALSRFKRPVKDKSKKKSKKESQKTTKLFFKLWSKNAKKRGFRRKLDIINVEEANAADQLHVNGSVKKHAAHVTFIDEVDNRGDDSEGAVITIAVPTLKTSNQTSSNEGTKDSPRTPHKDSAQKADTSKLTTISGQIAERENSGRTSPGKEATGKITHVKENTGRATPVTDISGTSGRQTPVMNSGRNTPITETKKPAVSSGRATPTNDKKSHLRPSPLKENLKNSPLVAAAGRPAVAKDVFLKDTPRSSSMTSTKNGAKFPPGTPTRPKTAPSRKPVSKVVAVKTAVIKIPTTPKPSSKASPRTPSAKGPSSVPANKPGAGANGSTDVNSSTRTAASVSVSVDKTK